VRVDGTDYVGTCDYLQTIFLGGDDYEPEDDTEETTDENADDATEELLETLMTNSHRSWCDWYYYSE